MLAPHRTSGPMAATRVLDQHLGTVGPLLVPIGPRHHGQHHRIQVAPLVGEMVGAAGPGPLEHAVSDKLLQPRTQDVRRDPETLQELVVAGQSVERRRGRSIASNARREFQARGRVHSSDSHSHSQVAWCKSRSDSCPVNTAAFRHARIRRVIRWHSCSALPYGTFLTRPRWCGCKPTARPPWRFSASSADVRRAGSSLRARHGDRG